MRTFTHNLDTVHPSWHSLIHCALSQMDPAYLHALSQDATWLPGPQAIFNAFSPDKRTIKTVLLGESPYPRAQSANGYAFWDAAVHDLWSEQGLSKPINRATSLRNFMKMLLIAGHYLDEPTQASIAALDKAKLISTLDALFLRMVKHGFLLLNASLVLHQRVATDAKAWRPFMACVFDELYSQQPDCTVLLFGKLAQQMDPLIPPGMNRLICEHPYNLSFINNPDVQAFFHPLHLLDKEPQ